MQLSDLYSKTIIQFKNKNIENAELEVRWLFLHILNYHHTDLILNANAVLHAKKIKELNAAINRRIQGEPLAYILGDTEFYGLKFFTDARALIPRADTESLIDFVLNSTFMQTSKIGLAFKDKKIKLLDIGTGTGAIGLTIKHYHSDWDITLSDISSEALEVAKKNAANLNLNATILQSNLFENIAEKYDIIISNPPYISEQDEHLINLQYEPQLALVAKSDGLDILHKIISQAKNYLNNGGCLILEHGYNQAEPVAQFLTKYGFNNVNSEKDLAGNFRFSYGTIN